MRKVNYLWYGLTGFLNKSMSLFTVTTTLFGAFLLSIFFPPATAFAFFGALLIGFGFAMYNIREEYKKDCSNKEIEKEISQQIETIKQLRELHFVNKFFYEKQLHIIEQLYHRQYLVKQILGYIEILKEKINQANPTVRQTIYNKYNPITDVIVALSFSDFTDLKIGELQDHVQKCEQYITPLMNEEDHHKLKEKTIIKQDNQLNQPYPPHKHIDFPHQESTPSISFKPPIGPSISIGIKTTLMTFGLAIATSTIIASLIVPPITLVAAMPLAVIGFSAALFGLACCIGVATSMVYHRIIAPHQAQQKENVVKLQYKKNKTKELTEKINVQTALIGEKKQHTTLLLEEETLLQLEIKQTAMAIKDKLDLQEEIISSPRVRNEVPHLAEHLMNTDNPCVVNEGEKKLARDSFNEHVKAFSLLPPARQVSLLRKQDSFNRQNSQNKITLRTN